MTNRGILWSGIALGLAVLGVLALLPGKLEQPLPVTMAPVAGELSQQSADWPDLLQARLSPAAEVQRPAVQDQPLSDYSLVGLVQVDDRMLAVIAGRGGTRSIAVGAVLDGYEAVSITDAGIVFERDGNNVVLRLAD
jgi:hypothetical protein